MRRVRRLTTWMCLCAATCLHAVAQGPSSLQALQQPLTFQQATLAEALAVIDAQYPDTKIHYVYNQLEEIHITATAQGNTAEEAVRSIVGDLPVHITAYRNHLLVEAIGHDKAQLTGHLVDEHQAPVTDAAIQLYDPDDLHLLATGFSDREGDFTLAVNRDDVIYRITHLGYQPLERQTAVGALGDIAMYEQLRPLHNISVDHIQSTYTMLLGISTLQVAGSALVQAGTAFDLLNYLPGWMLDDPTNQYYINGLPVSSLSDLTRIDASQIERIEYAMEDRRAAHTGKGRVINIVTREVAVGLQGEALTQLEQGQGTTARQLLSADVHRQRWDLMTQLNYEREGIYKQLTLGGIPQNEQMTLSRVNHTEQYATHGIDMMAGMNIRLTERHTVGFQYRYKEVLNDIVQHASELIGGFDPDDMEGLDPDEADWRLDFAPHHDLNLYYRGAVAGWQLQSGSNYYHDGISLSDNFRPTAGTIRRRNDVDNTLWAIRLDAERPVGKGRVSLGAEYSFTRRGDIYHQSESELVVSRLREQNRVSLRMGYDRQWQRWNVEAGLRLEYLDVHSNMRTLYPYASLTYRGERRQITTSYALHSSMPTYGQTNGYTHYNIERINVSGNPDLRPSTRHQVSVLAQSGHFTLTSTAQLIKDYIAQRIGANNSGYFLNYQNVSTASTFDATLLYARRFGPWQTQASATLLAQWLECRYTDGTRTFDQPIAQLAWRNQWQAPWGVTAMLDMTYSSSGHRGATWQERQGQIDVSAAKTWGRWTLRLRADDLLHTAHSRSLSYGNNVTYERKCYADNQRLVLTLKYSLGSRKQARKYEGVNAGAAEMERMK